MQSRPGDNGEPPGYSPLYTHDGTLYEEPDKPDGKAKYICPLTISLQNKSLSSDNISWLIKFIPSIPKPKQASSATVSMDLTRRLYGKDEEKRFARVVTALRSGCMAVISLNSTEKLYLPSSTNYNEGGPLHGFFVDSCRPSVSPSPPIPPPIPPSLSPSPSPSPLPPPLPSPSSSHPDPPRPRPLPGTLHPSALKNLTHIHNWKFGALAELVDNSKDAKAQNIYISTETYNSVEGKPITALTVTDDGSGMTADEVLDMMRFGHKETLVVGRIGRYGLGFKQGSIKLGSDVVVFTKCTTTITVAFLSLSYNKDRDVIIPIATWNKTGECLDKPEMDICLNALRAHSPFRGDFFLGEEVGKIRSTTGTRIVIFNLDEESQRLQAQPNDIIILPQPDQRSSSTYMRGRTGQISASVPEDYSLRAYLSILLNVDHPKLYLQGTLVETRKWKGYLTQFKDYHSTELGHKVRFGESVIEKQRGNCGMVMYWQNRAIQIFHRVGLQLGGKDGTRLGLGIIGVVDVNANMKPTNNKQSFQEENSSWADLQIWLESVLDDYFYKYRELGAISNPDWYLNWCQCVGCGKWRHLPKNTAKNMTPEARGKWKCNLNPDPHFKSCDIPTLETPAQVKCSKCNKLRELPPGISSWESIWRCDLNPDRRFFKNPNACNLPQIVVDRAENAPAIWVECDACHQSRKLPDGIPAPEEHEKWYCYKNPDKTRNDCQIPEEIDEPLRQDYEEVDSSDRSSSKTHSRSRSSGRASGSGSDHNNGGHGRGYTQNQNNNDPRSKKEQSIPKIPKKPTPGKPDKANTKQNKYESDGKRQKK